MILYDPQEFGGLEEYATMLGIGLQKKGHEVSFLSMTWIPAQNQYARRIREHQIDFVQVPKWLSRPASHWSTKERILAGVMWLLMPLVYLFAGGLMLRRSISWEKAYESAFGWLRGQVHGRLTAPDRRRPLGILLLNWWNRRWRPDLLHIQGYTNTLLFTIDWAATKNLPVVYEEHQTPDVRFNWWHGFENSINKAATVVAVSNTSAQALRDVCGVTRPIVVRNPLVPDPLASGWRRNGGSREGNRNLQVSTIARLEVTKGLNYLLDAVVRVRNLFPDVDFKVYGDGILRSEMLKYAGCLGLNGDEIFVGAFTNRDELSHIMTKTDIFVMSSILEGQPLAIVEAMSYGCPIVSTSVGGIPEIIEDGFNGLLCEPEDPECLANKIIALIEDPELRAVLGQAARQTYERQPFRPESVSELFVSVYEQVLS
jgi:glycosyltransferase involved in cell wall biosynthesis